MTYLLFSAVLLSGCLLLGRRGAQETRLVRSVTIKAPPSLVFGVISRIDRIPEWYTRRQPLPVIGGPSRLARWGEVVPSRVRIESNGDKRAEIQIRWVDDREFAYQYQSPHSLDYESLFRISNCDRQCVLTWEVRYRFYCPLDRILNPVITGRATYTKMGDSLESIRQAAERISALSPSKRPIQLVGPVWRSHASKAS